MNYSFIGYILNVSRKKITYLEFYEISGSVCKIERKKFTKFHLLLFVEHCSTVCYCVV